MARNVPQYLNGLIKDSGDLQAEILLGLVEATEEQTDAIKEQTRQLMSGDMPAGMPTLLHDLSEYMVNQMAANPQDEESRDFLRRINEALGG